MHIGGIYDLVDVVNKSAVVNMAQLNATEDGEVLVLTYDWQALFSTVLQMKGIKKLYYLRFTSDSPGCVC